MSEMISYKFWDRKPKLSCVHGQIGQIVEAVAQDSGFRETFEYSLKIWGLGWGWDWCWWGRTGGWCPFSEALLPPR